MAWPRMGRLFPVCVALFFFCFYLVSCDAPEKSQQDLSSVTDDDTQYADAIGDTGGEQNADTIEDTGGEGRGPASVDLDAQAEQWCDAIGSMLAKADCAYVTMQQNRLQEGLAAPNVPDVMTLNTPVQVSLVIGKGPDAKQKIQDTLPENNEVGPTVKVVLSQKVTASLSGSAFEINPQGAVEKNLGALQSAVWHWDVTPKRQGEQKLTMEVTSLAVDRSGNTYPIEGTQKQITVRVDVAPEDQRKQFFDRLERVATDSLPALESWQKWFGALAVLIAAIFGVWWAIRNGRSGQ